MPFFFQQQQQIKESMFATEKHHKDTLQQMEHKFFEEKVRLQQEASKKIAELAERAHSEAIRYIKYTCMCRKFEMGESFKVLLLFIFNERGWKVFLKRHISVRIFVKFQEP